jgi:hypothetical protein
MSLHARAPCALARCAAGALGRAHRCRQGSEPLPPAAAGCGEGRLLAHLVAACAYACPLERLTGVDVSEAGLRAAGRRLDKVAAGELAAAGPERPPALAHAAVVQPGQPMPGDTQLGAAVAQQQEEQRDALLQQQREAEAPPATAPGAMLPPLPRPPQEARREARQAVLEQLEVLLEAPAASGLPAVAAEAHRRAAGPPPRAARALPGRQPGPPCLPRPSGSKPGASPCCRLLH